MDSRPVRRAGRSQFSRGDRGICVSGFVEGLGGRDITLKDVESVLEKIKAGKEGTEWIL